MFSFEERMKALVDAIQACRRDRAAALNGLKEHTRHLLTVLRKQHLARATHLRCSLAANNRVRNERWPDLRQEFFVCRLEMRHRLQEMLAKDRQFRKNRLSHLRYSFGQVQRALAHDLHQAATTWRKLAPTTSVSLN